jgi:hypothetical protein
MAILVFALAIATLLVFSVSNHYQYRRRLRSLELKHRLWLSVVKR